MNKLLMFFLLASPLLLLFFRKGAGYTPVNNIDVWVFMIYETILLIYFLTNEGKARSNQVIWDNGHFSTNMRTPEIYGNYAVFWDGMNFPIPIDFKNKVLVTFKDNFKKVGDQFVITSMMYKSDYEPIPEDAKKIFRTYDLKTDNVLFGLTERDYTTQNPSVAKMADMLQASEDVSFANKTYAKGKISDFEYFLKHLAAWGNYGAQKGLLQAIVNKIESAGISEPPKEK